MKIKLLVGALVVLVVMNIAAIGTFLFVHMHGPHPMAGLHEGRRMHRGEFRHELSRDEREKLRHTMESFHREVRPLVQETGRLEDDLIASMGKDPVSRAHIDSLLDQISKNRLELAHRATDRMSAMGDSLSAEQRTHLMQALVRMRHGDEPRRPRDR
jgi:uncharacterized membrane protein